MAYLEYEGNRVEVDGDGYLVCFEDWNEKVACALAEREGVLNQCPLTEERMNIPRFLRGYCQNFHSFPIVPAVRKNVHQPKNCLSEQFLDPLQAWSGRRSPEAHNRSFRLHSSQAVESLRGPEELRA